MSGLMMTKSLLILFCLVLPRVDVTLLESGQGTTLRKPASTPVELKVLSYNIRWRSGDDLKEIIRLFRDDKEIGNPTLIALQEVDRQKKRSGNKSKNVYQNNHQPYFHPVDEVITQCLYYLPFIVTKTNCHGLL